MHRIAELRPRMSTIQLQIDFSSFRLLFANPLAGAGNQSQLRSARLDTRNRRSDNLSGCIDRLAQINPVRRDIRLSQSTFMRQLGLKRHFGKALEKWRPRQGSNLRHSV